MAKFIGQTTEQFENGTAYNINIQEFTGRIYKDLSDRDGEPDIRVAAFAAGHGLNYYQVFATSEDLLNTWELSVKPSMSIRTAKAWELLEVKKRI